MSGDREFKPVADEWPMRSLPTGVDTLCDPLPVSVGGTWDLHLTDSIQER